ncbi:unnamed protein product [Ixodes pacificus]
MKSIMTRASHITGSSKMVVRLTWHIEPMSLLFQPAIPLASFAIFPWHGRLGNQSSFGPWS